ncbi:hypothetical protein ACFPM0_21760 [Pseudonocardia sulfidoxydans]|uniref:hypothetical protein n=1 Tax=Pseudonocardia sulfidoxydans TaxID=54011 RepID=UPI0036060F59
MHRRPCAHHVKSLRGVHADGAVGSNGPRPTPPAAMAQRWLPPRPHTTYVTLHGARVTLPAVRER